MSGQRAFQAVLAPAHQTPSHGRRVYLVSQLLGENLLNMSRRTFFRLRAQGQLPFLVEALPRSGRLIRYRAEPVDRYLAGQWQQSRSFRRVS